jgi:glucose/arabinose dehydrogenase
MRHRSCEAPEISRKLLGQSLARLIALCFLGGGCDGRPSGPSGELDLEAVEIVTGLSEPIYLAAPAGDPRIFIVEQPGRIRIYADGALEPEPFLDISSRVQSGGERGLLSVAFHPDYATNGYFFVNYTGADGATRIERYRASADPDLADPDSDLLMLTVPQPFSNHNGGLIAFGPDRMLYIGMGDGGSGGDPLGHAQNTATLLGSLLRIDVDGGNGGPYSIPVDNPFVGDPNARPEIWAIGLRNPWRFSFDKAAGKLYLADVGQSRREEINVVDADEPGLNFGWNLMEGSLCYSTASGCSTTGLVLPILEYRNPEEGCSVTGGYVYRGDAMPALRGHYFHGDFCRGSVRSFRQTGDDTAVDQREWAVGSLGNITSFGVDAAGELYIVVHQGSVYRLEARGD